MDSNVSSNDASLFISATISEFLPEALDAISTNAILPMQSIPLVSPNHTILPGVSL